MKVKRIERRMKRAKEKLKSENKGRNRKLLEDREERIKTETKEKYGW